MGSLDIAKRTGKDHGHVKRDIECMFKALGIDASSFGCIYLDSMNRKQTEYRLDRELTETLITGYSIPLRHKVIQRLHELERQLSSPSIPKTLPDALRLAADLAEQNHSLKLVVTEQAPKVEVYDRISSATGSMCLTDAAKHLGIRPRAFCAWLRLNRWIFRREGSARWLAYQPRLTSGLLLHRITPIGRDENGDERAATQVRVTAKGLTLLASQLKAEGGV